VLVLEREEIPTGSRRMSFWCYRIESSVGEVATDPGALLLATMLWLTQKHCKAFGEQSCATGLLEEKALFLFSFCHM
jgi:hypothetical protein